MINDLLKQKEWRIIDQSNLGPSFEAMKSFAIDDTLCTTVGNGTQPATARSWVHQDTIVLGIQDTKLPHLEEGINLLKNQGYNVIVRNSGGLAVVLDAGVLNLSLLLPEAEKGIDINRGYEAMYALVKQMLEDYDVKVDAYEIVGSYCPGSFDLSIDGKKFAGISQRRMRGGVAVQIYLCVTGSGRKRAETVQQFYHTAIAGEETKYVYPSIVPETMASLSELIGTGLDVPKLMRLFLEALQQKSDRIYSGSLQGLELDLYQKNYERMLERNIKALIFS